MISTAEVVSKLHVKVTIFTAAAGVSLQAPFHKVWSNVRRDRPYSNHPFQEE